MVNLFSVLVLLGSLGVVFFVTATLLMEKKWGLNGKKSRFRIGILMSAGVSMLSFILLGQTNGVREEPYLLGEKVYLVAGGISSIGAVFLLAAFVSLWKVFFRKEDRQDLALTRSWIRGSLGFLGTGILLVGASFVLSNL